MTSEALSMVVGMGSSIQDLAWLDIINLLSSSSLIGVNSHSKGCCSIGSSSTNSGDSENSFRIFCNLVMKEISELISKGLSITVS